MQEFWCVIRFPLPSMSLVSLLQVIGQLKQVPLLTSILVAPGFAFLVWFLKASPLMF